LEPEQPSKRFQVVLGHEPASAGSRRRFAEGRVVVLGNDDDAGGRLAGQDSRRGSQAILAWHRDVHQHTVGVLLGEEGDRLLAIGALTDVRERVVTEAAQEAAHLRAIIGDEQLPRAVRSFVILHEASVSARRPYEHRQE